MHRKITPTPEPQPSGGKGTRLTYTFCLSVQYHVADGSQKMIIE